MARLLLVAGVLMTLLAFESALAAQDNAGVVYMSGSAPAPAPSDAYVSRKTVVHLGTLNVNKAEDAPAILALLQEAAERVCVLHKPVTPDLRARVRTCQRRAVADTIAALDSAVLSQAAAQRQ